MTNKKSIYVQDNFFSNKIFKTMQREIVSLEFKSRYSNFSEEEKGYGDHQRTYHHVELNSDAKIVLEVKKI